MRIVIDSRCVPPSTELEASEAFDSLSVHVHVPEHVWLDRETMVSLAGRACDAEWLAQLDAMIEFAASKGWMDESGRVRAHVTLAGHERADGGLS